MANHRNHLIVGCYRGMGSCLSIYIIILYVFFKVAKIILNYFFKWFSGKKIDHIIEP